MLIFKVLLPPSYVETAILLDLLNQEKIAYKDYINKPMDKEVP